LICEREDIDYIIESPIRKSLESSLIRADNVNSSVPLNAFKTIKRFINSSTLFGDLYEDLYQIKYQVINQRNSYNRKLKILLYEKPSLIVVLNDQRDLILLNIAKKIGIFSVCMCSSVISSVKHFAINRSRKYESYRIQSLPNHNKHWKLFIMKLLAPESILSFNKKLILMLNPIEVISYLINGFKFTMPGKRGSIADLVTATSIHEKTLMLKQGVSSSKIHLNGDNCNDALYNIKKNKNKIRKDLSVRLGISVNEITVLVGVPQVAGLNKKALENHKNSMEIVLKTLLGFDPRLKIIAKVHPKDNIINHYYIKELSDKIIIVDRYEIIELLLLSNLYIASLSSSIIDSILLDVPVITYNLSSTELFDPSYFALFEAEKCTVQVFDEKTLASKTKDLLFNHDKRERILKMQQKRINSFAINDGKCVDRNMSTIINALKI